MQIVNDIQIKVPREEVLRLLKHKKDTAAIDDKISSLINKLIEKGRALSKPRAIYKDFLVKTVGDHSVVLESSSFDILGKSAAHRLWNAKKVTLLVVTIGADLEKEIHNLTKEANMANAAILDAVGSVAVETVVDHINEITDKRAKEQGFKTLQRFSPGYGDWELKEQKGLLNLLNASQIGITLTNTNLMMPEKTVTAAIGWVKAE